MSSTPPTAPAPGELEVQSAVIAELNRLYTALTLVSCGCGRQFSPIVEGILARLCSTETPAEKAEIESLRYALEGQYNRGHFRRSCGTLAGGPCDCGHSYIGEVLTGTATIPAPTTDADPARLAEIRARLDAATPGPWRSMREGNQFLNCKYLPTAKCVGASRVDGLPRPWNPHAVISFMKLDAAEVSRFKDEDADFIAHAGGDDGDIAYLLALVAAPGAGEVQADDKATAAPCEGCNEPSTNHDSEGTPLCAQCYISLINETWSMQAQALHDEVAALKAALRSCTLCHAAERIEGRATCATCSKNLDSVPPSGENKALRDALIAIRNTAMLAPGGADDPITHIRDIVIWALKATTTPAATGDNQ